MIIISTVHSLKFSKPAAVELAILNFTSGDFNRKFKIMKYYTDITILYCIL